MHGGNAIRARTRGKCIGGTDIQRLCEVGPQVGIRRLQPTGTVRRDANRDKVRATGIRRVKGGGTVAALIGICDAVKGDVVPPARAQLVDRERARTFGGKVERVTKLFASEHVGCNCGDVRLVVDLRT